MRREFPARVRVAAYERCKGLCEVCGAPLSVGKFAYDHIVPDGLGGEPTLDNCMVTCAACHGSKTASRDVPQIAKAKRQRVNYIGKPPSKNPLPGSRNSRWKRKLDGTVIERT